LAVAADVDAAIARHMHEASTGPISRKKSWMLLSLKVRRRSCRGVRMCLWSRKPDISQSVLHLDRCQRGRARTRCIEHLKEVHSVEAF
jgi:hypothetical protein